MTSAGSPPTDLIAIDPGKADCGIAYFHDGVLVDCAFLEPEKGNPYKVAVTAQAWVFKYVRGVADVLIVEGQQVYGGPRKADPNDLIPLAVTVGGCMARIKAAKIYNPLPRIWTGGVPKEVRHRRLLGRVPPETMLVLAQVVDNLPKTKAHNVLDAVDLGFWALGQGRTSEGWSVQ